MTTQSPTRVAVAALTTVVTAVAGAMGAFAQLPPERACLKGIYLAKAKYDACEIKAVGTFHSVGAPYNFLGGVSKCHRTYRASWPKLQAKANLAGSTCDNPRFQDNEDGTVTDRLTALQWEKKTDDTTTHDKDNVYTWSLTSTEADGTAYTSLLATFNSGACFAGHCDWRLPTRGELQTILSDVYPCGSPCIDESAFGPTISSAYWSSTSLTPDPVAAWFVDFGTGYTDATFKTASFSVRAVRGGL